MPAVPYALSATVFDTDFYVRGLWVRASEDELVERLNNDWQILWRATQGRVSPSSSAWKKLDNYMALWVDWKAQYDDAILRRAADPFYWFGRDFDEELRQTWVPNMQDAIRALQRSGEDVREAIESSVVLPSVDAMSQAVNPPSKMPDKPIPWGIWLGVIATVGLIGAGAYLARR